MRIVLAIICVIPAAWVNARAQLSMGAGLDIVAAVILFAFMAPVFTLYAMSQYESRRIVSAATWATVAVLFMALNTTIALGGISAIRDLANDKNAETIRSHAARTAASASREARIARLRASVGASTSYELEAQAASLVGGDLYLRSKRCTDVTLADSQALCKRLAEVNAKIAATKEIERIEAERDATAWGASTNTEIVPQVQDAQIANISALIAPIFNVTPDHRLLAALLSGVMAIMLEIAADLGPVAAWGLLKGSGRSKKAFEGNEGTKTPLLEVPTTTSITIPNPTTAPCQTAEIRHFADERVVPFRLPKRETVSGLRDDGVTWREIALRLKISESTARRRMQSEIDEDKRRGVSK